MSHANNDFFPDLSAPEWQAIIDTHRIDEIALVDKILPLATLPRDTLLKIQQQARELVQNNRAARLKQSIIDAFMFQYDLSSDEGVALMCLAEALLRIPDSHTIDKLIRDKLSQGDWESSLGKSKNFFVNASTWALMLTGKVISKPKANLKQQQSNSLTSALKKLASKGGEPIIRTAISKAMQILGKQFVMGRSIEEALKRAVDKEKLGYRYSFDMLGEAAYTAKDAEKYFIAYKNAITSIQKNRTQNDVFAGPGISVKLSALHPRFESVKLARLYEELYPKLYDLALSAKNANMGFTIDAEEADRLVITLLLFEKLLQEPEFKAWHGLGIVVQAYQKRALSVLDWLIAKTNKYQQPICLRLVKGAYWDTEIKHAQVEGLSDYPVFTQKMATDANYQACVIKLLDNTKYIYPQFATHNALTLATVSVLAQEKNISNYEFQCLHGMGDALYDSFIQSSQVNCRIYAPVGTHQDLLAYLVRRLLENGANTSFVNRIADEKLPIDTIIADPIAKLKHAKSKRHSKIPLPKHLFGKIRENSSGLDLHAFEVMQSSVDSIGNMKITKDVLPSAAKSKNNLSVQAILSPIDNDIVLGKVFQADSECIKNTISIAEDAFCRLQHSDPEKRVQKLQKMADLLQDKCYEFYHLLIFEAGKTWDDAVNEVREAIDFCNYYALQANIHCARPDELTGPTGEHNQLSLHPRGVMLCISPWNFPLAIFLGQVTACLAVGNTVIAKPAGQTTLIAKLAIDCLVEAGFDKEQVQLLPTSGRLTSEYAITDERIKGVLFTGSTATARIINQTLANRNGPIIPLIAETGGQNAMIVDSSALPEQVTQDVIQSAFKSAGQRCSALRVLYLQDDVADKMLDFIIGAMQELKVSHPLDIATDIGPVIDKLALEGLQQHINDISQQHKVLSTVAVDKNYANGTFLAPHLIEIDNIAALKDEVFGPILHVIRFKAENLDDVIQQINSTGYGLTLGIHSRINETVNYIQDRVHAGNIYVNRNMTGAVVGVQPFGGEGLSGTGPKAGGPNYIIRLAHERTLSINTTASGGNATLMSLGE